MVLLALPSWVMFTNYNFIIFKLNLHKKDVCHKYHDVLAFSVPSFLFMSLISILKKDNRLMKYFIYLSPV